MQRPASIGAFAPCIAPQARLFAAARPVACAPRAGAAPFFASQAFGAPVATRATMPKAAVRMDVTVVVGDNEPIESAIRRFKKDVTKSGHLFELRRRRYFETNTEKRLRKAAAARRKARMARNMKMNRSRQQGSRSASAAVSTPAPSPASVTPLTPGTTPPNPRV